MLLLNTTLVSSFPLVALVLVAVTLTPVGATPSYVGTSTTICVCLTGKVYLLSPYFIWFCIVVSIVRVFEASFLLYVLARCCNSIPWFAVHPTFTYISFETLVEFPEGSWTVPVNLIIHVWFVFAQFLKSGLKRNGALSPPSKSIILRVLFVLLDDFTNSLLLLSLSETVPNPMSKLIP